MEAFDMGTLANALFQGVLRNEVRSFVVDWHAMSEALLGAPASDQEWD